MKKYLIFGLVILVSLSVTFCSKENNFTSDENTEWGKIHNNIVNQVVSNYNLEKGNLLTIEECNQLEMQVLEELHQQYGIEEDMRIFAENSSENCRKLIFGNQEELTAMEPKEFFMFFYENIDKLAKEDAISKEIVNTIKFAFEDILENEESLSQSTAEEIIQRFVSNLTNDFQNNEDFRIRRAEEVAIASAENVENNYIDTSSKYTNPWESLAICACDGLGGAWASAACILVAAIDGEIY